MSAPHCKACGCDLRKGEDNHQDWCPKRSEADRDPEVERRWYGVGEWVDES